MVYLPHLAAPLLFAFVSLIIWPGDAEPAFESSVALHRLANSYALFAAPHWIWSALSSYFEASRRTTIGGFTGAHVLLVIVGIFVLSSSSREAANGWFLYLIGAPFAVLVGATVGAKTKSARQNDTR